jgi:hypothetical protein
MEHTGEAAAARQRARMLWAKDSSADVEYRAVLSFGGLKLTEIVQDSG